MKRALFTALFASSLAAQSAPQTSILYVNYFNRAACVALSSMVPLALGCHQSVQIYLSSPDPEVTEFRVSIAYSKGTETLSQTLLIQNQSKVNRAVFDSGVDDVTLISESATPLKAAGQTVTIP